MESLNSGETPIYLAAGEGHTETVHMLVNSKATVNIQDSNGQTPLHRAGYYNHTETVGLLINHGAGVNTLDNSGRTPLHQAIWNTNTHTVSLLISHGAGVNSQAKNGWTPLHLAAVLNRTSIAALLISHGADVGLRNNDGRTPYDISEKDEIKEFLKGMNDQSAMLNRLLGEGSYESYDTRVMVTGQFGVGKTSLVMILVGDNVPGLILPTDGISLWEGRCGLSIDERKWILIDRDDYDALDVVYNKVLMSSRETHSNIEKDNKIVAINQEYAGLPTDKGQSKQIDRSVYVEEKKHQRIQRLESKMTKKEIKKKLELVLKSGRYKMKVGRLIFWDFGGQYVYYTTHQTFITYRALFLVVFNGSIDLNQKVTDVICFPGQHSTPTAAVFLHHWVNSILTYCEHKHPGIPWILFVATHKDKVPKENIDETRKALFDGIDELFRHHVGRKHLILEPLIFVNATDKNDPEIGTLKQVITDLTFRHPCWGEKMPNAWVPLELEIAELSAEGKQILSFSEIEELNQASEVSVLSKEHLKFFLQFQHSLGKIVYFDTPQLREFIIISPLFMIEVMKSFVTDEQFWPKDTVRRQPFQKMSTECEIQKNDLFKVWEQPDFSNILPHKEFIFDMLVHLDILSEQRRYDIETGSRLEVEKYFVPCMVTRRNNTSYMEKECTPNRAIGLAFVFKGSIIPPALQNRLISACLSMWCVKEYKGERLLFSGFVALAWDKFHDIVVCVESNRILVYIIHKKSKGLIVSDIAIGVRECINTTLQRISEFYQSSINPRISGQELPFHVEFACSDLQCYIHVIHVEETSALACQCIKHRKKVDVNVWYQNKKSSNSCDDSTCEGLSADALKEKPSDPEILRLSSNFSADAVQQLVIHLGLTCIHWDDIKCNYPRDIAMVKFLILVKWRNTMDGTYKDLRDKLSVVGHTSHVLCQVRHMKRKPSAILEKHLDSVPTDEILDALAPEIGNVSFQLGIELGRSVQELEVIQYNYSGDLIAQTKQILYKWRNDRSVKATLGILQQALVNVDRGTECLKNIIDDLGVKQHSFPRQPEEKTTKRQLCNQGTEQISACSEEAKRKRFEDIE